MFEKARPRSLSGTIALAVTVVAAIGSLMLLFSATEHPPLLLMMMFTGWVLLPFAALLIGIPFVMRYPWVRPIVYIVGPMISFISFDVYFFVLWNKSFGLKPAFIWLVVPGVSLIVIAAAVIGSVLKSRRDHARSVTETSFTSPGR